MVNLSNSSRHFSKYLNHALLVLLVAACVQKQTNQVTDLDSLTLARHLFAQEDTLPPVFVEIKRDIRIKDYFKFIDSLAKSVSAKTNLDLNEYAIVFANPWIIDSLRNTDYYIMKGRGAFQYDQRETIILRQGDRLVLPDSSTIVDINKKLNSTILDVNIPEYKLRIIQLGDTILTAKVRVGQPTFEYLPMYEHEVDLRTAVGAGRIIRIERNPSYINPDDGKRYDSTMRDDGKYTKMPILPWIEPSINGVRYGDMIHATTNISTLGKAYSHGCIGTSESDAWVIYYNAPLGTKVIFRYDLIVKNRKGDTIELHDIYHLREM